MNRPRRGETCGFTLVETMVAMILVAVVVMPVTLWLYKSRVNQAARIRFEAVQGLEDRMNRALLLRIDRDKTEEIKGPPAIRYVIRVAEDGDERRLVGEAKDGKGRVVTSLEAVLFKRGDP